MLHGRYTFYQLAAPVLYLPWHENMSAVKLYYMPDEICNLDKVSSYSVRLTHLDINSNSHNGHESHNAFKSQCETISVIVIFNFQSL